MRVILCDDEKEQTDKISALINNYAFDKNYEITVDCVNSPTELLELDKYDLYFLDYVMPEMNGVDLALKLKEKFNNAVTICYLTSFETAAIDVINKGIDAQAFLRKPADEEELFRLLDKLYNRSIFNRVVLKHEKQMKAVYLQDILYVEANVRKSTFVFFNEKQDFSYTFSEVESNILPEKLFFRIHRSYLINMLHVESFDSKSVKMKNGDTLPLVRSKEFRAEYTKFVLNL